MNMDSYWDKIYKRRTRRLHKGYDYSETVIKNSVSEELYNTNEFFIGFLDHINGVFVSMINSVKRIKTMANIALEKDDVVIN